MGIFFNTLKASVAVLIVAAASLFTYSKVTADFVLHNSVNPSISQMTPEQVSSHLIVYVDEHGKTMGSCSVTAIGPHAFVTASHCNDGSHHPITNTFTLDLGRHIFHIIASATDDRDHEIDLIDGLAFKHAVKVSTASPVEGEHIRFYGFGHAMFPSALRQGNVLPSQDSSDQDEAAGIFLNDCPVYPGDSGSAIYNDKNEIVGLVSFSVSIYDTTRMGAYSLNFSPAQLEVAEKFDLAEIMKSLVPQK